MIYLSDDHVQAIGVDWMEVLECIRESADILHKGEFAQPVKPYLRYKDQRNRIIAMPAYLGGAVNKAGIKWIASFPSNIEKGLNRAHSVTILNEAENGIPFCIINSNRVSQIRTAGVTGVVLDLYMQQRDFKAGSMKVGIIGWGPIGQMHLDMIAAICGDKLAQVLIFDVRPIKIGCGDKSVLKKLRIVHSWQEAYSFSDVVITSTVTQERYIDVAPLKGSLQLNISLRDYFPQLLQHMDKILVDDWEEVCRQDTDIEVMSKEFGLRAERVRSFSKHGLNGLMDDLKPDETVMFNPMGLAIFDIAVAWFYYQKAKQKNLNVNLDV